MSQITCSWMWAEALVAPPLPIPGGQTYLLTPFGDQTPTLQSGGFGLGSLVLASLLVPSLLPAQTLLPRGLGPEPPRTSLSLPLPPPHRSARTLPLSHARPTPLSVGYRALRSGSSSVRPFLLCVSSHPRVPQGVIYPERLALLSANIHRSITGLKPN